MGMSVFCLYHYFWTAPELGVVFLRFLLCPALFFECKRECRPGFCTPPPRYIHSVWSHCSGPKNLGIKVRKRTLVGEASFLLTAFWNCSQETSTEKKRHVGQKASLPFALQIPWKGVSKMGNIFTISVLLTLFRNMESQFNQLHIIAQKLNQENKSSLETDNLYLFLYQLKGRINADSAAERLLEIHKNPADVIHEQSLSGFKTLSVYLTIPRIPRKDTQLEQLHRVTSREKMKHSCC